MNLNHTSAPLLVVQGASRLCFAPEVVAVTLNADPLAKSVVRSLAAEQRSLAGAAEQVPEPQVRDAWHGFPVWQHGCPEPPHAWQRPPLQLLPLLQTFPAQQIWLVAPQGAQVTPLHTVPAQHAGFPEPQDWPCAVQLLPLPQTPLVQERED